jgi:hypothetical protein
MESSEALDPPVRGSIPHGLVRARMLLVLTTGWYQSCILRRCPTPGDWVLADRLVRSRGVDVTWINFPSVSRTNEALHAMTAASHGLGTGASE